MDKLDRLGWVAGMSVLAYGVRVGIRVNKPEALGHLVAKLPPQWKPSTSPVVDRLYSLLIGESLPHSKVRRFSLLYAGTARLGRSMDVGELSAQFSKDLGLYVGEETRWRVFVHASVVAWKGKAVVLLGSSQSGQTTLLAELVRRGATYYSDEYAVLDARGRVHPYVVALGDDSSDVRRMAASGAVGVKPVPLGMVVVSSYKAGAKWRARSLSAGQGALELLAQTVPARRKPKATLAALQQAVLSAQVLKGTRGEAAEMVGGIIERVGDW